MPSKRITNFEAEKVQSKTQSNHAYLVLKKVKQSVKQSFNPLASLSLVEP